MKEKERKREGERRRGRERRRIGGRGRERENKGEIRSKHTKRDLNERQHSARASEQDGEMQSKQSESWAYRGGAVALRSIFNASDCGSAKGMHNYCLMNNASRFLLISNKRPNRAATADGTHTHTHVRVHRRGSTDRYKTHVSL